MAIKDKRIRGLNSFLALGVQWISLIIRDGFPLCPFEAPAGSGRRGVCGDISAQVQYAPLQAGQHIWFSTPKNDTVSSNVPALTPKPSESLDFGNNSQIPLPFDLNGRRRSPRRHRSR